MNLSPRTRALLAVAAFALFGAAGYVRAHDLLLAVPQTIFFVVLVFNTFFSVRTFAAFQPDDAVQRALDIMLVALYALLAASMGEGVRFPAMVALLFALASIKYVAMRGATPHDALVSRKIRIDLLGSLLGVFAALAAATTDPVIAAWALAALFAFANLYLLWWRPMYRLGI